MLDTALKVATILGGISAVCFFVERLWRLWSRNRRPEHTPSADGSQLAASTARTPLWRGILPTPIVVGVQWVIAVFILHAQSPLTGLFALLGPLWVLPLSYFVVRFVAREANLARIVGGVAGGMIGAAIGYEIRDWATYYGLMFGGFFTSILAGHLAAPNAKMTAISALLTSTVLIAGFGVFKDLDFFMDPPREAFVGGALACVLGITVLLLVHSFQSLNASKVAKGDSESGNADFQQEQNLIKLDPTLLDILACVQCKGDLEYDQVSNKLICHQCRLKYSIEDGLPIMLIDLAEKF